MNVTTDPRLLKQLLLTQWANQLNPLSSQTTDGKTEDTSGLFQMLLSQLTLDSSSQPASNELLSTNNQSNPLFSLDSVSSVSWRGALTGDSGSSSAYDELITAAGAKYGVDPALIKGVIQSESSFHPDVVSSAGAKGLMQLMDDTARGLGVNDSFDPAQNIDGGTRFLSYLLRKYDGNVSTALAAYNAGPGRVDRLGISNDQLLAERMDTLPTETQNYVRKVLNASARWSA